MEISIPKPEITIPEQDKNPPKKLNDLQLRLVLIPLFAIAIPTFTGLADHNYSLLTIIFHYLYFGLISFTIFYGNRFLLFQLSDKFNWFFSPFRKVFTLLAGVTLYTIPITIFFIAIFYLCFLHTEIDKGVMFNICLLNVICVIFVAHIYETVFLIKHSESEMLRTAKLEQAKAETELEALKSQIDPHFIFNSLNTLSYLITQNPVKAKLFNDNLAEVYRYILQNKSRNLVLLREEMEFLNSYYSLLEIRFEHAVNLVIDIPLQEYDVYLIPPISLQLLMENAIKHNEFSDEYPLQVNIKIINNVLYFINPVRKKKLYKTSSKTGLNNLNERYKLIMEKQITIAESISTFEIILPLLKTS